MVSVVKNLIILFILSISINSAYCYTLTYNQLQNSIENYALNEAKNNLSNYSDEFKVNISGIPYGNIITNETSLPKIEITSQNSNYSVNSYKRVTIKDSKNNIIKSFPINVQTLVYKDVLVANELISFNKEINSNNTTIEKREISKYIGKTISSPINSIATRNYPKGSIILLSFLKDKSVVLRNSEVNIIFLSDKGLSIKIQGKALKEGAIGDTILVRSDKYNKVYNATVNSQNEVTVRI